MTHPLNRAPSTPAELRRLAGRIATECDTLDDPEDNGIGYGVRLHLAHMHLLAATTVLAIDEQPEPEPPPCRSWLERIRFWR